MTYSGIQTLRISALVGLVVLIIASALDSAPLASISGSVWILLVPFTVTQYALQFIPKDLRSMLKVFRAKEVRVPSIVNEVAQRLNVRPPKVMRVVEGSHLNAGVDGHALYVTEGLWVCLWTRMGKAVIAHEMAHLACKHNLKGMVVMMVVIFGAIIIATVMGEPTWLMLLLAAFTIVPVVNPLMSRYFEFEADRRAASVVGIESMSHALQAVAERSKWREEGDTHPSPERRLERLRALSGKGW